MLTEQGITARDAITPASSSTATVNRSDGTAVSGGTCPATAPANDVFTTYSGNTVTVTDQAGRKRKSQTDALSRLTAVWEPDQSGSFVNETDYLYDALNNLTRVDQKGNDANSANWRTRTFVYNSLSLLTSATNPETGPISSSGTTTYAYNDDGVLISKLDPRSITTCFGDWNGTTCNGGTGYDVLHRLLKKTYSNSDPTITYTYDQTNCLGLASCSNIGRRTGMTDAAGSEAWAYDSLGRTLKDQRTTAAITKNTTYAYNPDGSLASLTYPGGRVIVYTSDAAGRPIFALDSGLNVNYAWGTCGPSANGVCYGPQGAISFMKNGTLFNSTFLFNKRLQPCWSWVHTTNTGAPTGCAQTGVVTAALLDFQYDFGLATADNGNVNRIVNRRNPGRSITYLYDELNRVKSAVTDATSGQFCWGQLFGSMSGSTYVSGYDPWANLKTITPDPSRPGCATMALSKTINAYNKIIDSGFAYDNAGNMTTQPGLTAVFNAENQMTSAAGVTYTYDGDGKRVKKSNGKLYWYGMGSDPISESDLSGNITDDYIFFNGKRIARQNISSGVRYFYFSDHLGTTRVIAQMGVSSACYDADYYPFGGEAVIATNSCPQNYKFTGKERDSESGLDNFGARFDSSTLGRFMSPDPLYLELHRLVDPQSMNLYAYVRNNPLNLTDPTGMLITFDCKKVRSAQCSQTVADLNNREGAQFQVTRDDRTGQLSVSGDVDPTKLSNSERALYDAIKDPNNVGTVSVVPESDSVHFGRFDGKGNNTVDRSDLNLLNEQDKSLAGHIIAHETLEAYASQRWNLSYEDSANGPGAHSFAGNFFEGARWGQIHAFINTHEGDGYRLYWHFPGLDKMIGTKIVYTAQPNERRGLPNGRMVEVSVTKNGAEPQY